VLALCSRKAHAFTRRYTRIAATVASQAALLIENHRLYLDAEYQAALAERARLAREIHDGLAQTLSYLKLRTAQVLNWLQAGESPRAAEGLEEVRALLGEAYVDIREAIDGLRLRAEGGGMKTWLQPVEADPPPEVQLAPEYQAQIMRILQEALGNVRKHSGARRVWVTWKDDRYGLVLRVRDDGRGFDPRDVPPISRHGLRTMRERAELMGADFQIESLPGAGTTVLLRLPAQRLGEEAEHV
jgi:two-component system nitrate/nitrite sensor histidine kinase NarX